MDDLRDRVATESRSKTQHVEGLSRELSDLSKSIDSVSNDCMKERNAIEAVEKEVVNCVNCKVD